MGTGQGAVPQRLFELLSPEMIESISAIDISPDMIASLKKRIEMRGGEWKKIDAEVADVHRLAFEDVSFDAVLSNFVLQFVPDRPQARIDIIGCHLTQL